MKDTQTGDFWGSKPATPPAQAQQVKAPAIVPQATPEQATTGDLMQEVKSKATLPDSVPKPAKTKEMRFTINTGESVSIKYATQSKDNPESALKEIAIGRLNKC